MKTFYLTYPLAAVVIIAVAMLWTSGDLSGQISFTRLEEGAYLTDISDDGSVAAGTYFTKATFSTPLRWSPTTGLAPLGSTPRAVVSGLLVSGDGATFTFSGPPERSLRWTETTGAIPLSGIPGVFTLTSYPLDISRAGSVIVGSASITSDPYTPATHVPFRWSESSGMINLGGLGAARAVSADGSVITGQSTDANGLPDPFRWTEAEGMEHPIAPDGFAGFGSGLNPDGTVIVGSIVAAPYRYDDQRAFRWTEGEGLTLLGSVAGQPTHSASGVSADGSTIIGRSLNGAGYIWTPSSGARDLLSLLRDEYGLQDELEGWESLRPYALTPDARFIVGTGSVDYVGAGWILDRGANPAPIPVVPEAATYGLAAVALLFGFVLHRRRARALDTKRPQTASQVN